MKVVQKYAGLLTIALLMCGCGSDPDKTPAVKIVTVSHAVAFDAHTKQLSMTEYGALDAFMQSVPVSAVSYVGLQADDSNSKAVMHARQLKAYLVKQGVDRNTIHLQPVPDSGNDSLLVTVVYAVAVPPAPCPDWSKNAMVHYDASNQSNFGCAYNNDFILQLANPGDYVGSQGSQPSADASRDSGFVQKYRLGTAPTIAGGSSGSGGASAPSSGGTSP